VASVRRGALALLLVLGAWADLIDRIAVSVGNRVITRSDIERQIRVIAFQNGVQPDFSSANRHAVANKMIEQKLIQRELESSRYPAPLPAELMPAIEEFKHKQFKDDAAYQRALAAYDITEEDLLDVLLWERTLLRFIEVRFESGVQVTDQEVADYAKKQGLAPAPAERALVAFRADQQLDQWLRDARRRTPVIIHEEAFQ
jgi:peptidyl-prolyl cis-trans isomerase SurA